MSDGSGGGGGSSSYCARSLERTATSIATVRHLNSQRLAGDQRGQNSTLDGVTNLGGVVPKSMSEFYTALIIVTFPEISLFI